jgi:hypothetical protein
LGTTNNFARTQGMPLRPTAATDVLTSGKVSDVDLGDADIDGISVTKLVSVGSSTQVAARVPARRKRLIGRAVYLLTALAWPSCPGHKPLHARMLVGDAVHQVHTHQLNIANARSTPDARSPPMPAPMIGCCWATPSAAPPPPVDRRLHPPRRGQARHILAAPPYLITGDVWLETDHPNGWTLTGGPRPHPGPH